MSMAGERTRGGGRETVSGLRSSGRVSVPRGGRAMAVKVAINGFGRIGRLVFRILAKSKTFDVVAINDIGAPEVNAHLLRYDSTHGRYPGDVRLEGTTLVVDGKRVAML